MHVSPVVRLAGFPMMDCVYNRTMVVQVTLLALYTLLFLGTLALIGLILFKNLVVSQDPPSDSMEEPEAHS